jgi:hypothetical protein
VYRTNQYFKTLTPRRIDNLLDAISVFCHDYNMGTVFDVKQEINRLEDQKWNILLRHGQHAAARLWIPIDQKLERLYKWWAHQLIAEGRERELPFHRRRLK